MELVSDFSITQLTKSKFLIPQRVYFTQNNTKRVWDGIKEHSDVEILLFNISRNVFILVKQFRPAVYLSQTMSTVLKGSEMVDTGQYPGHLGVTIELCAGIVDKDLPCAEIARAEVLEECGYNVPTDNFCKITSFRNGSEISGSLVTLYYAEVTDAMRESAGGGLAQEGELIEVVELSIKEARNLIYDETQNREPCLLVALQWFFHQIYPKMETVSGKS
ncbi:GDP-mannose-4,6-dehydratase nudk [Plakobranchus ocellatus]|uniref:Uridine diphosphate glucose pyrophosphatase NUDT14 n=1 Tax=Plakobranchus ocellatus TaxID=259542 RepID=A0AAV4CTX1_9GAST|nr:GDP-mannose-4,6-dehydratase nudk [Plakobranchus ocellatus]